MSTPPSVLPPRQPVVRTTSAWQRLLRRFRKPVAVFLLVVGLFLALSVTRTEPEMSQVTVFAADLPAGHRLTPTDLRISSLPTAAVPAAASADPNRFVDQITAGPVSVGEFVTQQRLISGELLAGEPADYVAVPLTLADAASLSYIRVGDVIDVVATAANPTGTDGSAFGYGEPQVVAQGVRVLAVPGVSGSGSVFSDNATTGNTSAVIVGAPADLAPGIASANSTAKIAITVRPQH